MQDKLQTLLNKIKLDSKDYKYFEGGQLEKIILNNTKDSCNVVLNLKDHLTLDMYLKLSKLLNDYFKINTSLNIISTGNNHKEFYKYFDHFVNELNIEELKDNDDILYRAQKVEIQTNDKIDENKLKQLELLLNKVGFVVTLYLKEKEEKTNTFVPVEQPVVEETNNKPKYQRKPKEKEDHPDVLYGRLIKDEFVRMDTIVEVNQTVTVEAYVFGSELREIKTKDGREFKILNLKLTDFTDSIYATLFMNGAEEVPKIEEKNWYKIRARVKEPDKYNPDITLSILDINILDKKIEEVIDDAPVKRVELHAHTMMSQMDGVVNAEDLVKTAKKWGMRGIAVTDHNGCQAFPNVFNLIKGMNKGVEEKDKFLGIYGTELTLIDDTVNILLIQKY